MILFGEKHGIKENFKTYLRLIKKFNSCEKINVYFETSVSAGVYIDEYINGNELFPLEEFLEDYKRTMFGTKDFQTFILSLREYNKRAKRKIKFNGIDLEFQKHITQRIKKCTSKLNAHIKANEESTIKIKSLNDKDFEIEREKALVKNFFQVYEPNAICFMGAWHTRNNSNDENFVKSVQEKNINFLSIEILYQDSIRTVQTSEGFETININDTFDKEEYKKYGAFCIAKNESKKGIFVLKNCKGTKMIL